MKRSMTGFTIVELLIVIIVIAILAAISIVAYNGITRRAVESMLKQDLASANKQIAAYRATNDSLPLANNCPSPATTEICLAGSAGTTFTYSPNSPTSPTQYQILATNGTVSFRSSNGSSPELAYGSRFVALTNLVQNGDFSAGQTGWTIHCQNSTQCLFSGGVLTIIANPPGYGLPDGVGSRFHIGGHGMSAGNSTSYGHVACVIVFDRPLTEAELMRLDAIPTADLTWENVARPEIRVKVNGAITRAAGHKIKQSDTLEDIHIRPREQ